MKRLTLSILYLILHPRRAVVIIKMYSHLKGIYRIKIILAHAYKESIYNLKNTVVESIPGKIPIRIQQIINIHDGLTRSGGLTDRLKGICTLYCYSKKNKFDFRIYFIHPFHLKKYLEPNIYKWEITENEIIYNINHSAIYTWENQKTAQYFFHRNKEKKQLHISCNSGESFSDYSFLFNELFKPSKFLLEKLEPHLENLGGSGNYISISFRFQNMLGEFKENTSNPIDEKDAERLIEKCLSAINKVKNENKEINRILITSDSNIFREVANSHFEFVYSFFIPEETGHMDFAEAGKGKELTAFLDLFLISNAQKAYQIRTSEMYNSDFPRMAAKINNVPYEMILI